MSDRQLTKEEKENYMLAQMNDYPIYCPFCHEGPYDPDYDHCPKCGIRNPVDTM